MGQLREIKVSQSKFMKALVNESGSVQAYLEEYLIIDPQLDIPLGIVLGGCVYDSHGHFKGKLVGGVLYGLNGEKLAETGQPPLGVGQPELRNLKRDQWNLLEGIRDHQCPWIQPSSKWSGKPLVAYLSD